MGGDLFQRDIAAVFIKELRDNFPPDIVNAGCQARLIFELFANNLIGIMVPQDDKYKRKECQEQKQTYG